MKEATASTWLFQIVIVLILLFTGFLCVSINFTAAYKISDALVLSIQREEGFNINQIKEELAEKKYTSDGVCGTGWKAYAANGTEVMNPTSAQASFCIKKVEVYSGDDEMPSIHYYKVKVFYSIDVPILSELNLNVQSNTKNIYGANDVW